MISNIKELIQQVLDLNCHDANDNERSNKIIPKALFDCIAPTSYWTDELLLLNMKPGDVYQIIDPRATRLFGYRGFFYHDKLGFTLVTMSGHQYLIMLLKFLEKPLVNKISVHDFYYDEIISRDFGSVIDDYIDSGADFFYNSGAVAGTINYTNKESIALRKAIMVTRYSLRSLK